MLCDLCGELTETTWDEEQGDLCDGCTQIVARARREAEWQEEPDAEWYAEQTAEWAEKT